MTQSTPTRLTTAVPRALKAWQLWLMFIAGVLVIAAIWTAYDYFTQDDTSIRPLATDSEGSGALTAVLRDEGVDVEVITNVDEGGDGNAPAGSADLVVLGSGGALSQERHQAIYDSGADLLILDGGSAIFDMDLPVVQVPAWSSGVASAQCEGWPSQLAPTINSYPETLVQFDEDRAPLDASQKPSVCYRFEDMSRDSNPAGVLATWQDNGRTISVLADSSILNNPWIREESNAAVALGLMGNHDTVFWYELEHFDPQLADEINDPEPFMGLDTVVLLWGVFLFLLALFAWQGRRLGPIVRENLPVSVAATESVYSLASLYRDNRAWDWASRVIRTHELTEMAHNFGISSVRDVDAVLALVAEHSSYSMPELQARWRQKASSASELKNVADWWLTLRRQVTAEFAKDAVNEPSTSAVQLSTSTTDKGNA